MTIHWESSMPMGWIHITRRSPTYWQVCSFKHINLNLSEELIRGFMSEWFCYRWVETKKFVLHSVSEVFFSKMPSQLSAWIKHWKHLFIKSIIDWELVAGSCFQLFYCNHCDVTVFSATVLFDKFGFNSICRFQKISQ